MTSMYRWGSEAENKPNPIAVRGRGAKMSFLTSTRFPLQSGGGWGGVQLEEGPQTGTSDPLGLQMLPRWFQGASGAENPGGPSIQGPGRAKERTPLPGFSHLPSPSSHTPPLSLHPHPASHTSQLDLKIPSGITLQAEIWAYPRGRVEWLQLTVDAEPTSQLARSRATLSHCPDEHTEARGQSRILSHTLIYRCRGNSQEKLLKSWKVDV